MGSPIPRYLRSPEEEQSIPLKFREHVVDLKIDASRGRGKVPPNSHRAKFAPGLASVLVELAGSKCIGDPMAGVGTLAHETGLRINLNDIDPKMRNFWEGLKGAKSCKPADRIKWTADVCVFSPPYYPKTDRKIPCAHDDNKRGPVVGFRDSYDYQHPKFIGNPGGVNAILEYRKMMTEVYDHLKTVCGRMVVVTKNWTRRGVELRLDLDTILMAQECGWRLTSRHGWEPPASLWARYNAKRGGGVRVEDVLIFDSYSR